MCDVSAKRQRVSIVDDAVDLVYVEEVIATFVGDLHTVHLTVHRTKCERHHGGIVIERCRTVVC